MSADTVSDAQRRALRRIGTTATPGVVHGVSRATLGSLKRRGLVVHSRDAGGPVLTERGRRALEAVR